MTFPLENRLPYALMALLVLAVFYAIYFSKVLAQKRQGIQTHQIGRRKEKSVHTVELLMSAATLGAPVVQLLSIIFDWSCLPANARFTSNPSVLSIFQTSVEHAPRLERTSESSGNSVQIR